MFWGIKNNFTIINYTSNARLYKQAFLFILIIWLLFYKTVFLSAEPDNNSGENKKTGSAKVKSALVYKDEELAAKLISMQAVSGLDEVKQKEVFAQFQRLISILMVSVKDNKNLLLALCEKQVSLFPGERKPHFDLAAYYNAIEDYPKMLESAKKSVSLDNKIYKEEKKHILALAYTMMGQYYLDNNKFDEAYDNLNNALKYSKDMAIPFFLMGNVCFRMNRYVESVNAYTMGFTTDPNQAYPIDFAFFADGLFKNGLVEKARQILEGGVYRYPNEEGLRHNLAQVLKEENKFIEAYLYYNAEKLMFGKDSPFYKKSDTFLNITSKMIPDKNDAREVGVLNKLNNWDNLIAAKKYDEALIEIKSAIDLYGKPDWMLNLMLEKTLFKLNRYDEALNTIGYLDTISPNNAHNYLERSNVYFAVNKQKEAVEALSKALALDPDNYKVKMDVQEYNSKVIKK